MIEMQVNRRLYGVGRFFLIDFHGCFQAKCKQNYLIFVNHQLSQTIKLLSFWPRSFRCQRGFLDGIEHFLPLNLLFMAELPLQSRFNSYSRQSGYQLYEAYYVHLNLP